MADNLKDLVKSLILERCYLKNRPLDFATTNPLFIPIKNNQVSLSSEIESLEDADSCMLFFTYFRDNTVPDKYRKGGWITFRNPYSGFGYIDSKKEKSYVYYDDGFEISGINNSLRLSFNYEELMNVSVTEESVKELWNCYLIAKKCLQTQKEKFESTKSELEGKIELLSKDYETLKQRHEKIVKAINEVATLTKTEE